MSAEALRRYVVTLREGRGISRREFAKQVGVAQTTYHDWETGTSDDLRAAWYLRAVVLLQGDILVLADLAKETATPQAGETAAAAVLRGERPGWQDQLQTESRRYAASLLREAADLMDHQGLRLPDAIRQASRQMEHDDAPTE